MECQNTIKNLKINKNKTIGEIVVVVEGESEEFKLMKYIFTNVLDYNYIPIKRNKIMRDELGVKLIQIQRLLLLIRVVQI